MEIVSIARLLLGTIVLLYVSNCWLNQRFWSRKHFSWKPREYWPEVFWFNIILGTIMGAYMISSVVL
ncbi:MAG: hypothetical protein BEU00_01590 [Marine Group III euryarchaeote CG-Epi3]|mgnify:CR=1 FL=1|jgi:hypothetical protein|uniref:Uncharacterized protein n=1 Tax=Marine Group III euryarchaeote CG-Epi3 TaxID=1888997 RepID=A0A1J5TPF5_9ARCH|nr:MAG: hypothetical protein BEU00_01590 [Marine Group III euryarchaeote CG-Epi3]